MNMQKALSSAAKAALVGAFVLALPASADAGSKVRGEYAQSKAPLFRVGQLNKELSALCRRGLFKQRGDLRLSIGYLRPKGYGITGIANKGWNLHDPTGVAEPDKSYHFHNQGYSDCRVYVATIPPNARRAQGQ